MCACVFLENSAFYFEHHTLTNAQNNKKKWQNGNERKRERESKNKNLKFVSRIHDKHALNSIFMDGFFDDFICISYESSNHVYL